jgi:hypothetical protein
MFVGLRNPNVVKPNRRRPGTAKSGKVSSHVFKELCVSVDREELLTDK